MFEIETTWVQSLNDGDARELIARLCKAELVAAGSRSDYVRWGGDQRAADGGVDVRTVLPAPLSPVIFYGSSDVVHQVKAEAMGPAKLRREMTVEGAPHPLFAELVISSGSYVVASTRDSCSNSMLNARLAAMRDVVVDFEGVTVDFLDARRIADWVERYPTVSLWLRQRAGVPTLQGWQPYAPWAHNETDIDAPYQLDETARMNIPGENDPVSVLAAIQHLRRELRRPASATRLIGLSGVGKTRFAQTLFDARLDPDTALNPESVIYTDIADSPDPVPDRLIEAIGAINETFIVIVDNCGADTHSRLTQLVRHRVSNVTLLTIEYDLTDDIPEATQCYEMRGSSSDVLETILLDRSRQLSQIDARRLAELSEGNARIAFAIASTLDQTTNLGQLRDHDLFNRLFQQRQGEDRDLRETAMAISIVYSFDGENFDDTGELAVLMRDSGKSVAAAARDVAQLRARGLVQGRAHWRALLPHALANRVAQDALSAYPSRHVYRNWIEVPSTRLNLSFCHRLGYLHDFALAVEVANLAFAENGVLGGADALDEPRMRQFVYLAPLSPSAALAAIERAIESGTVLNSETSSLVMNLAYDAALFERAAAVLMRLAVVQIDEHNPAMNSAIGDFESLFAYVFSGTMANGVTRCAFLRSMIFHPPVERAPELALRALTSGLETDRFTSSRMMKFGSRQRSWGWRATTQVEHDRFFCDYIDLAFDIMHERPALRDETRQLIVRRFRSHWRHETIRAHLITRVNQEIALRSWPDIYISAKETLGFDGEGMKDTARAQLETFMENTAPESLASRIRAAVLLRDASAYREFDRDIHAMEEALNTRAEALGREAAVDAEGLAEIRLELLTVQGTARAEPFGFGVGMALDDIGAEIEICLDTVRQHNNGNYVFAYWLGLGRAWHDKDPDGFSVFLNSLSNHPVLAPTLVAQQMIAGLDAEAMRRFEENLSSPLAQPHRFNLTLHRSRDSAWTDADRLRLIELIGQAPVEGALASVIEALSLYVHREAAVEEPFRLHILTWLSLQDISQFSGRQDYYSLETIFEAFAGPGIPEPVFTSFADQVDPALFDEDDFGYRFDDPRQKILGLLFKYEPRFALRRFATAEIIADPRQTDTLFRDRYLGRENGPLGLVPVDILIEWCQVDPEPRFAFAAHYGACLTPTGPGQDATGLAVQMLALVAHAPDPAVVINELVDRLPPTSGGSFSAIIETRITWLDDLNPDQNPNIEEALELGRSQLRRYAEVERVREGARRRGRDETFE